MDKLDLAIYIGTTACALVCILGIWLREELATLKAQADSNANNVMLMLIKREIAHSGKEESMHEQ